MTQIFHRSTNTISRLTIFGSLLVLCLILAFLADIERSGYNTEADFVREQPIQFSHKHHAGDDGIDCRYCHTTVEHSAFAGIPPTKTCMNCHSELYADSPYLEPVRESVRSGQPIRWNRVHNLPDFVYFDHSIHIHKGIGCSTCHGRVDQMPLVRQVASLHMAWCLGCHRQPENYIRPRQYVFDMNWTPPRNQTEEGLKLVKEYHVRSVEALTSCDTCHR